MRAGRYHAQVGVLFWRAHATRAPTRFCSYSGVAALAERHVKQKKREGELKEQLKKLRRFRLSHQTCLFDLQREARANASSFADIQVRT